MAHFCVQGTGFSPSEGYLDVELRLEASSKEEALEKAKETPCGAYTTWSLDIVPMCVDPDSLVAFEDEEDF